MFSDANGVEKRESEVTIGLTTPIGPNIPQLELATGPRNLKSRRKFASSTPPNVLVIVADDLGWGDVSLHGSLQIPTPNMDLLARTGVVFGNYYVSPVCSPSRSALLTGRHPVETGMQQGPLLNASPEGLPLDVSPLLPQVLRQFENYSTHAVGKWHLGFFSRHHLPESRGFDTHVGYWSGMTDYYDHTCSGYEGRYWGVDWHNGSDTLRPSGQYSTEWFTEKTVDIIRDHARRDSKLRKPLFLYFAPTAVHGANGYSVFQVPPRYITPFRHIQDRRRRLFAGMLAALDDAVGAIIRSLANEGMLGNTLVYFTSDNGGAGCGRDGRCIDESVGSNAPLRGTKYTLWEGGIRVSGWMWGSPGVLPITRPYVYQNLMHISDLYPTILSSVGMSAAASSAEQGLYGVDHWAKIVAGGVGIPPRDHLLHNIDDAEGTWAVRRGRWKLLNGSYDDGNYDIWYLPPGVTQEQLTAQKYESLLMKSAIKKILDEHGRSVASAISLSDLSITCGNNSIYDATRHVTTCDPSHELCLFDIEADPCERVNLACQRPQIVSTLLKEISAWRQRARDPVNMPPDPRSNPALHGGYWTFYT